ncbi:MAG: hypothetical protein R3B82_01420 [Sandaracinaceae bacterium]
MLGVGMGELVVILGILCTLGGGAAVVVVAVVLATRKKDRG